MDASKEVAEHRFRVRAQPEHTTVCGAERDRSDKRSKGAREKERETKTRSTGGEALRTIGYRQRLSFTTLLGRLLIPRAQQALPSQ